jgi:hypothetical protein
MIDVYPIGSTPRGLYLTAVLFVVFGAILAFSSSVDALADQAVDASVTPIASLSAHRLALPMAEVKVDLPFPATLSGAAIVGWGRDSSRVFSSLSVVSLGVQGHRWLFGDRITGLGVGVQARYEMRRSLTASELSTGGFGNPEVPNLSATDHALSLGAITSLRKRLGGIVVEVLFGYGWRYSSRTARLGEQSKEASSSAPQTLFGVYLGWLL